MLGLSQTAPSLNILLVESTKVMIGLMEEIILITMFVHLFLQTFDLLYILCLTLNCAERSHLYWTTQ